MAKLAESHNSFFEPFLHMLCDKVERVGNGFSESLGFVVVVEVDESIKDVRVFAQGGSFELAVADEIAEGIAVLDIDDSRLPAKVEQDTDAFARDSDVAAACFNGFGNQLKLPKIRKVFPTMFPP